MSKRKTIQQDIHEFNNMAGSVPNQAERMHDFRHISDSVPGQANRMHGFRTMSESAPAVERDVVSDFTRRVRKG